MGRKSKNRIKKHVSHDPEFIAEIESQAIGSESFGEVIERLLAEKNATILELREQLAGYQSHDMREEGRERGIDEAAIRQVSLSLQVWIVNPADIAARSAFESALRRVLDRG